MSTGFSEPWRLQGEIQARDSGQWLFYARTLLRGAVVTHEASVAAFARIDTPPPSPDLPLGTVALFLCAQSIEVALKSLALQRDGTLIDGNRLYTHDLVRLARDEARVSVGSDDEEVLRKCRKLIEWAGRYPVPKWTTAKDAWDVPAKTDADGRQIIDASALPWTLRWDAVYPFAESLFAEYTKRATSSRAAAT